MECNIGTCSFLSTYQCVTFYYEQRREAKPFACHGFCVPAAVCVSQRWLLMTQTFTHLLFWHILWIFLSGGKKSIFFFYKVDNRGLEMLSRLKASTAAQRLAVKLLRGGENRTDLQAAVVPHRIVKGLCVKEHQVTVWCWHWQTRLRASETQLPLNESCHLDGWRKWSADLRVWEVIRFSS